MLLWQRARRAGRRLVARPASDEAGQAHGGHFRSNDADDEQDSEEEWIPDNGGLGCKSSPYAQISRKALLDFADSLYPHLCRPQMKRCKLKRLVVSHPARCRFGAQPTHSHTHFASMRDGLTCSSKRLSLQHPRAKGGFLQNIKQSTIHRKTQGAQIIHTCARGRMYPRESTTPYGCAHSLACFCISSRPAATTTRRRRR